ncbi:DegV family protein [Clostridium polynesiense]|uniref:DegV family protein n=1 Tax=Clostridium polynesiense TaxID=1325933 RepID=UPI00058E5745|nr:DegV family protein [Clostridium polynesiense]
MEKIALITDSGCDLDKETLERYNIYLLPFRIIYKDKEYLDRVTVEPQEVYDRLEEEIPSTSLPSMQIIEDVLTEIENKGYTHVIALMISSGLSGTYNSMRLMCENHPKLISAVYDTKTLSMGQGAMALACADMIKEGKSFDDILEALPRLRKKIHAYFTIETLEYLKKGGRIGKVTGTIGDLLNIKPIIHVNDDGIYHNYSKTRGKKQALSKLTEILKEYLHKVKCSVWLLHGGAPEEARRFFETLKRLDNITLMGMAQIGPALGVHTGPGLIGLIIKEEE